MWLDWDQAVTGIASQPFRLRWAAEEGEPGSHVPDYFAERGGGPALVVDCRPADRRGPRDLAAFEATRRACAIAGWEYRLAGAPDPAVTVNCQAVAGSWLSQNDQAGTPGGTVRRSPSNPAQPGRRVASVAVAQAEITHLPVIADQNHT